MARGIKPFQSASAEVLRRVIENLKINCTSNTQVVIKQNSAVGSSDGTRVMTAAADITVDITTSGANGLDTGSEAANTWYYIWMILNPTTSTVAGLLSTSTTAPTMPSGYTKKRLVGAVRNDGSSNFLTFNQIDRDVYRSDSGSFDILSNGTAGSWTAVDVSARVPIAVSSIIRLYWYTVNGHIGYNGTSAHNLATGGSAQGVFNLPHSSGNIYYMASAGMYLSGAGFILDL